MSWSCEFDSDSQSDVDMSSAFFPSRSGFSFRTFGGFHKSGGGTEAQSGGDHDSPTRGTQLKIQRFDHVYDPDSNKMVVREVDNTQTQTQSEKVVDSSAENVFNIWREIVSNPNNPAAPPCISTFLDIKSKYIRAICREVVGGYMGISWTVEPLRVDTKTFIAYLLKFQKFADDLGRQEDKAEDESTALAHLTFLLSFIENEYADQVSEISSYLRHGEITFDLLWAIMLHRAPLYTNCAVTGQPRFGWVSGMQMVRMNERTAYLVDADCVDYNSRSHRSSKQTEAKFGITQLSLPPIWEFKGSIKINDLPCFPAEYHPNLLELTNRLWERGKKWATLQGMHHMHYASNAFYRTPKGCIAKHYVDSRIMIDWKACEEIEPNFALPRTSGSLDIVNEYTVLQPNVKSDDSCEDMNLPFAFASPIVYGFSFMDKRWLMFDVDHVRSFEWSDEPINNLILPPSTKVLIKALVERHSAGSSAFDDFVKGKGQGLVINLFGNPGVGKTLTVEATSEHVKRPLYIVGAGDLGTSAHELDEELTRIFKAATKWGAIVLIDEADVFLEERSLHDLARNAVVAVFLRQLEYYRGILFLTTNRVRTFDEAFQSRIHLSLHYNDLDCNTKRQIWLAFVKKFNNASGLSEAELDTLAEKKINGRQIKNVVGTATALAENSGEALSYKHLTGVLEIMDQFTLDYNASRA